MPPISVKVQCGCGQKYAFDVEPQSDAMPYTVACPVCGADGTVAANQALSTALHPQVAGPAPTPIGLRAGGTQLALVNAGPAPVQASTLEARPSSAASPRRMVLPGQIDPAQVEHEARAKMLWGDPPEEVLKFLRIQGLSPEDAANLTQTLFQERAATIRANGIKKIITGCVLVCVPFVTWFVFASVGVIPLKLFAVAVIVGLWGAYMVLKGIFMSIAPKSEPGDVSEQ